MSAFDQAFEIVVGHEGGYSNNSADPGGETKFGISRRSYPNLNIATLTLDQAKAIYQTDFWNRAGCDLCDPGLALVLFDAAVNNGVGQAVRWLQAAVGANADGAIGPATKAAIANADPPAASPAPADAAAAPAADPAPDAPPAGPPPSTEDRLAALEEMVFETLLPRLVAVIGEIET